MLSDRGLVTRPSHVTFGARLERRRRLVVRGCCMRHDRRDHPDSRRYVTGSECGCSLTALAGWIRPISPMLKSPISCGLEILN